MIPTADLLLFAAAAFVMVMTPGPNMMYLLSRSICQGRRAGVISLVGVVSAFLVHMLAAALGLTALFLAVPFAYELLKWAGAAYLLFLAVQAIRPGRSSPFEARQLALDPPGKLFVMGFLTNLLNPKIAVFYMSILPQFVSAAHGSMFVQSIELGTMQIAISFTVNLLIALSASHIAAWFSRNPRWLLVQKYVMGFVLASLAVRLATQRRASA